MSEPSKHALKAAEVVTRCLLSALLAGEFEKLEADSLLFVASEIQPHIDAAVAEAVNGMVKREDVKPLVEALEWYAGPRYPETRIADNGGRLAVALAHAREKGLL